MTEVAGTARRRLLVVSYFHPPFPGSGGNRWTSMARYLRAAGHDLTIVASDAFGGLPDDDRQGVVRVSDLKSAPGLRRVLGRGELRAPGAEVVAEPPAPALLTKVLVPDAYVVSWLPWAVRATRRLCRERAIDCVVTTGPPESVHLVGLALGRRRPAWIADFRDGWVFEPLREQFPTAAQRRLDAAFERRVVRAAECSIGVTDPITDDLRTRYGARAVTIPNAYDPALDAEAARAEVPPLPEDRLPLVHTGTLSLPRGRDARPFLEALGRLATEAPELAARLVLVHVGPVSTEDERFFSGLRAQGLAVTLGRQPRPVALALQRRARALLLITSDEASQSTGKVYEYLAAGRPIVALAHGNAAARIVEETGTGVTVPPRDTDAIVAALRDVVTGELERRYAPRGTERFTYPAPAEAVGALVEEAIAARATA
jgi:glycosyltransferase involved in cell wall biosynthesis